MLVIPSSADWFEVYLDASAVILSSATFFLIYKEYQRNHELNKLQVRLQYVGLQKEVYETFKINTDAIIEAVFDTTQEKSLDEISFHKFCGDIQEQVIELTDIFPKCQNEGILDDFLICIADISCAQAPKDIDWFYKANKIIHARNALCQSLKKEYTLILKDHLD